MFRTIYRSLPVVKLDVKFPTLSTILCSDSLPFNKKYASARIRGMPHLLVHKIKIYCFFSVCIDTFFFIVIHLIPKWQPINYSFVCMLISPLCIVNMYKKQMNFEEKMRRRVVINTQTNELFIGRHFGIRCTGS